jgi:hypothetical protein
MRITKRRLKQIIKEEVKNNRLDEWKMTWHPDLGGGPSSAPSTSLVPSPYASAGSVGQVYDQDETDEDEDVIEEDRAGFLREQDDVVTTDNNTHHWPRVDWSNVSELVDKWADGEEKAFDKGDPSMIAQFETTAEAKKNWDLQVDQGAMEMEAELTARVRKVALTTMQEYTDKLINGDYA